MKPSDLKILPLSIFWSVVLYVVYKYINIDLGLFLSLNSLILFLKSEQDKQVTYQDNRLDKLESSAVSKVEHNNLLMQIIRLKAGLDMLAEKSKKPIELKLQDAIDGDNIEGD